MTDLTNPIFQDADAAREHLENIRWPDGPVCPHCGAMDASTALKGKAHRKGVYQCNACREQFTVTVGTVYERSKIPLNKWLLATHLMAASKKGISAHQLHRMLGITYKSAWFMCHRIREAMKDDKPTPMGGEGKIVEADETYYGKRETPRKRSRKVYNKPVKSGKAGGAQKNSIVGLVERGGHVRTFHVNNATMASVRDALVRNVRRDTDLMTDESRLYTETGKEYASHGTVKHSAGEYARREGGVVVHTNTIEGYFSIFKRGMKGIYQHCGESHLHRYLAEFDFRYNTRTALGFTDNERRDAALKGIEGKRLTYRRTNEAALA